MKKSHEIILKEIEAELNETLKNFEYTKNTKEQRHIITLLLDDVLKSFIRREDICDSKVSCDYTNNNDDITDQSVADVFVYETPTSKPKINRITIMSTVK